MAGLFPLLVFALAVVVVAVVVLKVGEIIAKAIVAEYNHHFPTGRVEMHPVPTAPQPKEEKKDKPPGQTTPPPIPIPVPAIKPVANTGAEAHEGKEEDQKTDCEEELKKYPVHAYRDRKKPPFKIVDHQSHHVFQNALFENQDGDFPSSVGPPPCDAYSKNSAPCIPLRGGTKDLGSPHGKASSLQATHGAQARQRGVPHTYGAARKDVEEQLRIGELTETEISCVMAAVEAWLKGLCPKMNDSTVLRTPG